MKTNFTFLISALLFSVMAVNAQDCSDLFISEYVEGWSNNKAIEIYNPTAAAIDASGYGITRFSNGATEAGEITYLTDITIEAYDVLVVVLDKRDPDGESFEAPVWDELQVAADIFVNPEYENGVHPMYYNGNDAIALLKDNGATLVDLVGKIGDASVVEADGWGGYTDMAGEQGYITQDHTLIRKSSVLTGVTANPDQFDPLLEFDSLAANTFEFLGMHACSCDPNSSVQNLENNTKLSIYPNPVQDGFVTVAVNGLMTAVEVYDFTGKLVVAESVNGVQFTTFETSLLPAGTYMIRARLESGLEVNKVLLKK